MADSRASTNLLGEGAWARMSRFEAAVHFTPTTQTCKCWVSQRRLVLMVSTKSVNDGQDWGST